MPIRTAVKRAGCDQRSAGPVMRQHFYECHRYGRPRPDTPRAQTSVTGTAGLLTSGSAPFAPLPSSSSQWCLGLGFPVTVAGAVAESTLRPHRIPVLIGQRPNQFRGGPYSAMPRASMMVLWRGRGVRQLRRHGHHQMAREERNALFFPRGSSYIRQVSLSDYGNKRTMQ